MRALFLCFVLVGSFCLGQDVNQTSKTHQKGELFMYWGWNRAAFSSSDIKFSGDNYDFTLEDVIAHDRQTPFNTYDYFHPLRITIPQFNARIGYYITDRISISIGSDHMKYVVDSNQVANISGYIENSSTEYDGIYENEPIVLASDFLLLEHTDGLNYINIEARRTDNLKTLNNNVSFDLIEGFGLGVLVPRTNATLLNNSRHDDFHISGYGLGAILGFQINLWQHFFILTEAKGGFINMPDVRTTEYSSDRASQHFFFAQANVVFGVRFNLQ